MSIDPSDVQQRFRAVAKCYPLWRFIADLFFDVSSWRMIGADVTTLMITSKSARRAARTMEGASPEMLEALASIARINEQRSSDIFRAVFLGYVSAPVALAAMLSDAAPDFLTAFISEYASGIVILLIGSLVFPLTYFCGNWRGKQIAWVIELYRAGAIAPLPEANARR
ncbi:MAG: hypothetical protein IT547_03165 [Hyphomonadaceae bacterium]|jgi:hypothetical protein|nr:hypothetical protein [Hyphomonadaceae bacterium]